MWQQWVAAVVKAIPAIEEKELVKIFTGEDTTHNSSARVAAMYRDSVHHHVTGTPFAFVNGIMLQHFLETKEAWMQMLQDTYDSQIHL